MANPGDDPGFIGNTPADSHLADVLETAARLAPPPVRRFSILGYTFKWELNINTIGIVVAVLGTIFTGSYQVFEWAREPYVTAADVHQLQLWMGKPRTPTFLPGEIKTVERRMDALEQRESLHHDDELAAIESLHADILAGRKETNDHLEHIDDRMDNLIESQSYRVLPAPRLPHPKSPTIIIHPMHK